MDKKIKIFVSYHKNSTVLKNEVLEPIEVGAALKNEHLDMISDKSGDNISEKNESFCELTAQYWAWKNCDFDYIGFMHYRRHLNFSDKKYDENIWGLSEDSVINDFYIKKYSLDEQNVKNLVYQYDIVTVNPWSVKNAGSKNNYDHYKSSHKKLHIEDYDKALKILSKKYPEYIQDIKSYNENESGYYTNIFIMKKECFSAYCSWLFDILFELEKQIDISKYDKEEKRVFGYISEWLFGIYLTHVKRTTNLKIKELQRTYVKNCDFVQDNSAINICFSTDNNYIQHLGAAVASILKNTKTNKKIDIYVLNDGALKNKNKRKLKSLENLKENTKINFLEVQGELFKDFYIPEKTHFTSAIYYRYLIPLMFDKIEKLIYLDCDLIVKGDIEELYNTNLCDNPIAAIKDIIRQENELRLDMDFSNFYCNSGVLVMNLAKMRKNNSVQKLFELTDTKKDILLWPDQDVINLVFEGKIKYLDLSWNFQYFYDDDEVDFERDGLENAKKNPKIIHFVGHIKPWNIYSLRPYENEYFKYLKLTPWKNFCYIHAFKSFLKSLLNKKNTNKYVIISILGFRFKKLRKLQLIRNDIKKLQKEVWKLQKQNHRLSKSNHQLNQTAFDLYLDNLILKREFEPYDIKKYLERITQAPEYLYVDSSHNYLNILLNQKEFEYQKKLNSDNVLISWELAPWEADANNRNYAISQNKDIIFIGDSFLRSVYPQSKKDVSDLKYRKGISFCVDDLGWYYDATRKNRLEVMLNDKNLVLSNEQIQRARNCIDKIIGNYLTKYNHQPIYSPKIGRKNVRKILVVNQTFGDMSIVKGMADEKTFSNMLNCAISENPDSDIIIKTHPDTLLKGGGYFKDIEQKENVYILDKEINPISLIQSVDEIYVCTSQFGFEALMCGKKVHCFGAPFYSNWGLTDDRVKIERRKNKRTLEELFYIAYIVYSWYVNPKTNKVCEIEEALDYLTELRNEII